MGYRIQYGPAPKIAKKTHHNKYITPVAALLITATILTAKQIWPEEVKKLQETLFPWSQESVKEAFSEFTLQLDAGKPFRDCAVNFCKEILNDAQNHP